MVDFGPLTAEIRWRVWGTPANFNRFRVLAALLHGTLVVGISQTLRRWTEGGTYIRQDGHHVGPTFYFLLFSSPILSGHRLIFWCLPWCVLSVNLECISQMCCTRLAEKHRTQKIAKNRHRRTIGQSCRAISSHLRHVLTIGKSC